MNLVARSFENSLTEKSLELNLEFGDVVKRNCYSDETVIRSIVYNLMENAIKFTDIGSISLKMSHPDLEFVQHLGMRVPEGYTDKSYILFSITDTGSGINESELATVFDPYAYTEKSPKKSTSTPRCLLFP